jgi:hypothetical protein
MNDKGTDKKRDPVAFDQGGRMTQVDPHDSVNTPPKPRGKDRRKEPSGSQAEESGR